MSKFIDEYLTFLNDNFSENQLENRIEIAVPFSDKNNDPMKIYAEENEKEGDIYLTDDGYIIENLISSGCDITTPARKELLQNVTNKYGISISKEYELFTYATLETFPQREHALIQCMIAVNNLHITLRKNNTAIFLDDIKEYFGLK